VFIIGVSTHQSDDILSPQIDGLLSIVDITLDGHPLALTNDEAYKVQSDLFNLTLPANNLWGEPAGPDQAITQGWWLMLKPLPPDQHTVHYTMGYRDSKSDPTIPPGQGNQAPYIQDVTYRLVVK
jgi:hypothetical protein